MEIKKDFYKKKDVADEYLEFRYGGNSGKLVLREENSTLQELLPHDKEGIVLDVPVGTGRISNMLNIYRKKIGADFSKEMLNKAKEKEYSSLIRCDVECIPLIKQSMDIVISLRFFSHYQSMDPFIKEYSRLLRINGVLIFDTVKWSPRSMQPEVCKILGGKVFVHIRKNIIKLLASYGFELVDQKSRFLLPNIFYRYLPYCITKGIISIEKFIPDSLKVTTFWKFQKINN
jgi:ubiquinone/menaquinone biosynthesis C-methylase UbiE